MRPQPWLQTSQTYKKASLNRWVFKEDRKAEREVAERTESGREFQTEGAEEEKERSPYDLEVRGLQSVRLSEEERSVL